MPYSATVFEVMIASPGDVQEERNAAREVVYEWNAAHSHSTKIVLQPVGWETHSSPSMGDRPQAIINKQVLRHCDLLLAIFWTRLGTPTGQASSGTVEEIDEHRKQGKPAMVYFSSARVPPESFEAEQYKALMEFKKECQERGLVESFDSHDEFRRKFSRQLATTINEHEYFKKVSIPSPRAESASGAQRPPTPSRVSKEAAELLLEASNDPQGCVMRVRDMSGITVQTNRRSFVEEGSPKSRAMWEAAVDELALKTLIKDVGHNGEIYEVTHEGYNLAQILSEKN
jgi:hypothetical protein